MRQETANLIVKFSDELDFEVELRSDYSGRSMYGRTTHAIVTDNQPNFIAAVAAAYSELEPGSEEASDFVEDCKTFRFDQMGKGIVVY